MDINQYYQNIFEDAKVTMHESLKLQQELAKVHLFANDLLTWYEILKYREEAITIKNIASELQFSVFSLACGLYRQSFISLRIVLESSLATIFFSAYELELQEWKKCNRDINWKELIGSDSHTGVLSKRWKEAFFPELDDESVEKYRILAKDTYRNLSEFVHSNPQTWELNKVQITFNQNKFNDWMKKFSDVSKIISFVLSLRFLKNLKPDELKILDGHLIEHLGNIQAIRNLIGLAN